MMISTGLPELSSEKDLNYLKETLVSTHARHAFYCIKNADYKLHKLLPFSCIIMSKDKAECFILTE